MKNKLALTLTVIAFAALMTGAAVLYRRGENAAPRADFVNRMQTSATAGLPTQGSSVPVATAAATGGAVAPAASAPASPSASPNAAEPSAAPTEDPLVPDFSLSALDGKTYTLSEQRGKIVVLNFWASWCPPCKAEMPDFELLHKEFEAAGDVILLSVNLTDGQQETREKAEAFMKDNGYTFRALLDDEGTLGAMFGIQYIPTTAVIDAEGRLVTGVQGGTTREVVLEMVEEARGAK